MRDEEIDEVGVQGASLQSAGGVSGEQSFDARRSPPTYWLPRLSLHAMTAPRSPRSAWLLVGCTPSIESTVQSAGQIFSRLRAKPRPWRSRAFLAA